MRTTYKSKSFEGEVRGGVIWVDGKGYDNPSFAARAVGHGSVNGWRTWDYLNARGEWRPLDELRDEKISAVTSVADGHSPDLEATSGDRGLAPDSGR